MGNKHAFKQGRDTPEHIAERRELLALLREIKDLVERVDEKEQGLCPGKDLRRSRL